MTDDRQQMTGFRGGGGGKEEEGESGLFSTCKVERQLDLGRYRKTY